MKSLSASQVAYDAVEHFEGLHEKVFDAKGKWTGMVKAYRLTVRNRKGEIIMQEKHYTIGFGQTGRMPDGRPVVEGLVITLQEARDAVRYYMLNVVEPLVRETFNPKTQSEMDACCVFAYNFDPAKVRSYTLPKMIALKDRSEEALAAINDWWVKYNKTKGVENGLYIRRMAELCIFHGLPWRQALQAYWRSDTDRTDPNYILDLARAAKPIASLPDPPKPAKPVVAVKVEPLPEVKPEPQVGTKPISPKTVKPEEVPYKIDPNAGLKPLEESERAIGYFWQNLARLFLRLTGLGTFGTAAAGVANVVQSDAVLGTALLDLTIPLLVFVTGIVIAFVAKQYGDWRRKRGEESASQGMY
jgi:GH24 family phage-related lysozyme (muramidase)